MNKAAVRLAKASILRALTEDFTYHPLNKDGRPSKRTRENQALFNARAGHAVFSGTDLTMVMQAVVLGLYQAMEADRVRRIEAGEESH